MSFGDKTGYPTWENFIPEFKTQNLIMSIMSELAYQVNCKLTAALVDKDNYFTTLGTTIYFTTDGQYSILQPDCGHERLRISYPDGTLLARYYQFPVPGIDPDIEGFDFATEYNVGVPPVYGDIPPLYNEDLPCPINWPPASFPSLDTIAYCVPNPGQPFFNQSKMAPNISANVKGYFKPPPDPCEDNPYVIAFHCINNSRASSNNAFDTLQYFQFQSLVIRTKGVVGAPDFGDGVDMVNSEGDLIDKDGNPITVMYYLEEVDYFKDFDGDPNPSFGYNLTYNSFVFSFRGSTYLPDFIEEVIPPEMIIADLKLSNPAELLARYRPWLVNKASSMYKSIAKTTNFEYFLTPFPEEESIRIAKNYSVYLGSIAFTGHSYGGSLANILAQFLVERFPLFVNVQTYSFAPVPYIRKGAPPLDPDFYEGLLFIRAFVNDNDVVPFLKVPNVLNEPQNYLQPLEPTELYQFYHIKSDECGNTVILERIKSYCFPCGGVPIYLSVNKDHNFTTYVENISKINNKQFEDTILSKEGIENYTVSNQVIIKTLVQTIPEIPFFIKRTGKMIDASPKNPFHYMYKFIGFNDICPNFKNLIESLKLC